MIMKQILRLLAVIFLPGCALTPNHMTVGGSTVHHALNGQMTGIGGAVGFTYDLR